MAEHFISFASNYASMFILNQIIQENDVLLNSLMLLELPKSFILYFAEHYTDRSNIA